MTGARAAVLALVLDRFVDQFDFNRLTLAQRRIALAEMAALRPTFSDADPRLALAFGRFEQRLLHARNAATSPRSDRDVKRLKRLLRWLVPLAMGGAAASMIGAAPAFAYTVPAVGATVFNPLTRTNETVVQIIGSPGYAVRTSTGNIIIVAQTVGDTFTDAAGKVQKVTAVTTTTYGTGSSAVTYVTGVTLTDASNVVTTTNVVTAIPVAPGSSGTGPGTVGTIPTSSADLLQFTDIRTGGTGSSGHAGFEVCVLGY